MVTKLTLESEAYQKDLENYIAKTNVSFLHEYYYLKCAYYCYSWGDIINASIYHDIFWYCIVILIVSIFRDTCIMRFWYIKKRLLTIPHSGLIQQMTDLWHFSCFSGKIGSDNSCKLSPQETICMKYQSLFSWETKKNISNSHADFFLPSMLSINTILKYFVTNIETSTGLKYHDIVSYQTLDIMIISWYFFWWYPALTLKLLITTIVVCFVICLW